MDIRTVEEPPWRGQPNAKAYESCTPRRHSPVEVGRPRARIAECRGCSFDELFRFSCEDDEIGKVVGLDVFVGARVFAESGNGRGRIEGGRVGGRGGGFLTKLVQHIMCASALHDASVAGFWRLSIFLQCRWDARNFTGRGAHRVNLQEKKKTTGGNHASWRILYPLWLIGETHEHMYDAHLT